MSKVPYYVETTEMSLDVYLEMPYATKRAEKIYVRDQGATRKVSRKEWDEMNPGVEPVAVAANETHEVFWRNITHNLGRMASEAGIYEALWRPGEIGAICADTSIRQICVALLSAMPEVQMGGDMTEHHHYHARHYRWYRMPDRAVYGLYLLAASFWRDWWPKKMKGK